MADESVKDPALSASCEPNPAPEDRRKAAAARALREAEARRAAAKPLELPEELGGRNGPEPIRFGDWESKGITSDF